ncbi:hypothetical protein DMO17_18615 [Aquipseudomonas alcaligenes]|uniref:Uncharacterized protein n=1 Tax=Aquipseudomonas alcaligenes TaxID=43263 RepID=A0A2V4KF56_AQUAC|nr:hypothetical protein [Pseudomonas alcaligenes]PYC20211.1 hypothetical protein DMO17_18615 [Pseudomonas alcaligenes]
MSLPQVLFSLMIMGMLSQATVSLSGLAIDTQKRAEMRAKLIELSDAVLRHYNRTGQLPADLSALELASPVSAAELQNGYTDPYSQAFTLLHRNDPAQTFTAPGSSAQLVAALIARNGNGQLDSALIGSQLSLGGDDYAVFVTRAQLEAQPRWQTRQRLQLCSSALALYSAQYGVPAGIEPMLASGHLPPAQALDAWGGKLLVNGVQCYSAGPDHNPVNSADNVDL